MQTCTVTKADIKEVTEKINNGVNFANNDFQFVWRKKDGFGLRFDLDKGTYKFYYDFNAYVRACVRFLKRGW